MAECKKLIEIPALLMALLTAVTAFAQYPNPDATILFSRNAISGTARSAGAGGAFSSVGADLGSMDLNPAGLGLYHQSEICATPGIRVAADQSVYNGTKMQANHTIFELAQGGAALNIKARHYTDKSGPYAFRYITLGISYQTNNDFDRNQSFGLASTTSIANRYAQMATAGQPNLSPEAQAFSQAGIIALDASSTAYTSNVRSAVQQSGSLSTSGANNKVNIGFGSNFGDKLFFGLSLGIPILNYQVATQIAENGLATDSVTHFQGYQLTSTINESGAGVTGKVGLIYKPAPWLRVGIAYSLPTWYFISETYSVDLAYQFDTMQQGIELGSVSQPVTYQLRTPMKGTIGASFYLHDHGFISIDYDIQNLGSTHYHFGDANYAPLNTLFNSYLKSAYGYSHTVRVGIEGAIKSFRLRAGYSYTNSPFKSGQNYAGNNYNAAMQSATLGAGFLFKRFYLDLAYVFSFTKDGVAPYPSSQIPLDQVNSRYISHNILLTVGFKLGRQNNEKREDVRRRSSDELPKYIDPGDKY